MTDFQALRLAPPVLEAWAPGGRLVSRAVVDFDLEWSLLAADAIKHAHLTNASTYQSNEGLLCTAPRRG